MRCQLPPHKQIPVAHECVASLELPHEALDLDLLRRKHHTAGQNAACQLKRRLLRNEKRKTKPLATHQPHQKCIHFHIFQ
jgi:hypothetical protein